LKGFADLNGKDFHFGLAEGKGVAILTEVVLSAEFVDSPTFSGDAGSSAQNCT
jgi:hypothetical protein